MAFKKGGNLSEIASRFMTLNRVSIREQSFLQLQTFRDERQRAIMTKADGFQAPIDLRLEIPPIQISQSVSMTRLIDEVGTTRAQAVRTALMDDVRQLETLLHDEFRFAAARMFEQVVRGAVAGRRADIDIRDLSGFFQEREGQARHKRRADQQRGNRGSQSIQGVSADMVIIDDPTPIDRFVEKRAEQIRQWNLEEFGARHSFWGMGSMQIGHSDKTVKIELKQLGDRIEKRYKPKTLALLEQYLLPISEIPKTVKKDIEDNTKIVYKGFIYRSGVFSPTKKYEGAYIQSQLQHGIEFLKRQEQLTVNGEPIGESFAAIDATFNGVLLEFRDKMTSTRVKIIGVRCPSTGDLYALTVDPKYILFEAARKSTFLGSEGFEWGEET